MPGTAVPRRHEPKATFSEASMLESERTEKHANIVLKLDYIVAGALNPAPDTLNPTCYTPGRVGFMRRTQRSPAKNLPKTACVCCLNWGATEATKQAIRDLGFRGLVLQGSGI